MHLFFAHVGSRLRISEDSSKVGLMVTPFCQCQRGGRAHNVAVLSADVLTNEKSEGCHLPDITLSECWATTTLGNGAVKSPCRSVKTSLKEKIILSVPDLHRFK